MSKKKQLTNYPILNKMFSIFVLDKKLSPLERLGNRLGYMGSSFIMMSPYLLPYDNIGAYTYLVGAVFSLPQVWIAKQWNLVMINVNLLFGYGLYIYNVIY
tara:strand:+ start:75 stop:377 length:303 start_codon:yes stop_codon:yes gene_type:complete